MQNFKSTRKYYYFFRFGFIAIASLFLIVWTLLILTESPISINGIEKKATIENSWMIPIFSIALLVLHFLISSKSSYIEINNENILIENRGASIKSKVENIESIKQIPFVRPPLYRLKLKSAAKSYFFVIYDSYIEFGGYVKDLSQKRDSLDKIKKEKNIA